VGDCEIFCSPDGECPNDLNCSVDGWCRVDPTEVCYVVAPTPDAQLPGPRFEVAYVWEWDEYQLSPLFVSQKLGVVINTGGVAFDLSLLTISMVSDDNPNATFGFYISPADGATLPVGAAAGALDPYTQPLVGPLFDQTAWTQKDAPQLGAGLEDHPAGVYDVHATVTLTLGNQVATLPFLIHNIDVPPGNDYFVSAQRVSSQAK